MASKLTEYRDKYKDLYGDMSLGEVARDAYDRGGHAENFADFDDWAKKKGFDRDILDDNIRRETARVAPRMEDPSADAFKKGLAAAGQTSGVDETLQPFRTLQRMAQGQKPRSEQEAREMVNAPFQAMDFTQKLADAPVKQSVMGKIIETGKGMFEVGAGLAEQVITWPAGKVAGAIGLLPNRFGPGSGKRAKEYEQAFHELTDIQPTTEAAKNVTNVVGKVMEVVTTPAKMAGEAVKYGGIPQLNIQPGSEAAQWITQTLAELGTFWAIGKGGEAVKGKLNSIAKEQGWGRANAYDNLVMEVAGEFGKRPDLTQGYDVPLAEAFVDAQLRGAGLKKPSAKDFRQAREKFKQNPPVYPDSPIDPKQIGGTEYPPTATGSSRPGEPPADGGGGAGITPETSPVLKQRLFSAVSNGMEYGMVAGKPFGQEDVIGLIGRSHERGILSDDDLDVFGRSYPALKSGINDIRTKVITDKINQAVGMGETITPVTDTVTEPVTAVTKPVTPVTDTVTPVTEIPLTTQEAPIVTPEAKAIEKIVSAVTSIDGKIYEGKTHGESIGQAIKAGDIIDTPKGYTDRYGNDLWGSNHSDLFKTSTGRIIDRFQADKEFGVTAGENINKQKPPEAPGSTISGEGTKISLAPKERKPFQAKTLLSWVRAQGGIWDESLKGEANQFIGKESGVIGLLSKGKGKSFDELAALAKDYGWIGEDATAKDFIDLLSKDVAASKQGKERVSSLHQNVEKGVLKELSKDEADIGERADDLIKEGWKVYGTGHEEKVGNIDPGDRILSKGEEYSHVGYDKDGKAILKDGETLRLDAFDKIPVEAMKEGEDGPPFSLKSHPDQTNLFGEEPKAEKPAKKVQVKEEDKEPESLDLFKEKTEKQAWEMTKEDWLEDVGYKSSQGSRVKSNWLGTHEGEVRVAIQRKLPVPEKVLSEYPDLLPKAEAPKPPAFGTRIPLKGEKPKQGALDFSGQEALFNLKSDLTRISNIKSPTERLKAIRDMGEKKIREMAEAGGMNTEGQPINRVIAKILDYAKIEANKQGDFFVGEVKEGGVTFTTGTPVTFNYIRNTEKSPKMGSRFGQDIEPKGRYVLHDTKPEDTYLTDRLPGKYEKGTVTFENPLVIKNKEGESLSWKQKLVDVFGKKGEALTDELKNRGIDGIVSYDKHGTSEIVILSKKQGGENVYSLTNKGRGIYQPKREEIVGDESFTEVFRGRFGERGRGVAQAEPRTDHDRAVSLKSSRYGITKRGETNVGNNITTQQGRGDILVRLGEVEESVPFRKFFRERFAERGRGVSQVEGPITGRGREASNYLNNLGVEHYFFEATPESKFSEVDGFYEPNTGAVFLNVNLEGENVHLHELTHRLEYQTPEAHQELKQKVLSKVTDEAFVKRHHDEYNRTLKNVNNKQLSPEALDNELVADVLTGKVDKAFSDPEAVKAMVREAVEGTGKTEDVKYLDAVKKGDTALAQKMVDEAARKAGYNVDSEHKMQHQAPDRGDHSLATIMDNDIVPKDYWTHPQYYQHGGDEYSSFHKIKSAVELQKKYDSEGTGKKARIWVYRSIPKNIKEDTFRNGDWVTPSYEYAKSEGFGIVGGYRVIRARKSLSDLWWDANSINELGFDDGRGYVYKNTKNNRKLIDPITRDDAGKIIPLSKRFNKKSSDIRFTFAGQKATGADLGKMADAVRMDKEGKSSTDIWDETGWVKGADGKFRFEIDDSKAKMLIKEGMGVARLSEYFDHPALFKQYPGVKNIWVALDINKELAPRGEYKTTAQDIGQSIKAGEGIISVDAQNHEQAKSILLHEIQHFVQEQEGFARGGNLENAPTIDMDKLSAIRTEINQLNIDPYKIQNKKLGGYPLQKYEIERLKKWEELTAKEDEILSNRLQPYEAYRRLAGEAEAREVQNRMGWSAEQRAIIPPSWDGISEKDLIVRMEGGKAEVMSAAGNQLYRARGLEDARLMRQEEPEGSLAYYDQQSQGEWLRGAIPPKDGKLTLYRATPTGAEIKPGDYVTNSLQYAKDHINNNLGKEGKISKIEATLDDIYPADGPGEFWYAPKETSLPVGGIDFEKVRDDELSLIIRISNGYGEGRLALINKKDGYIYLTTNQIPKENLTQKYPANRYAIEKVGKFKNEKDAKEQIFKYLSKEPDKYLQVEKAREVEDEKRAKEWLSNSRPEIDKTLENNIEEKEIKAEIKRERKDIYYRIQPVGRRIRGHLSETSAGNLDGLHVFDDPRQIFFTDGPIELYGNEVVELKTASGYSPNYDVEGVKVDSYDAKIVKRYSLDEFSKEFYPKLSSTLREIPEEHSGFPYFDHVKDALKNPNRPTLPGEGGERSPLFSLKSNENTGQKEYDKWVNDYLKSIKTDSEKKRVEKGLKVSKKLHDNPASPTGFDMPIEGKGSQVFDLIQFKIQDNLNSLRKVQGTIEKQHSLELPDDINTYQTAEAYRSKAARQIKEFKNDYDDPLVESIHKSGFDLESVEGFLYARHAPEANKRLQDINPNREDNEALSGMTNKEAAEITSKYANNKAMLDIAAQVDAITKRTRQILVSEGLATQEEISAWENTYKNYVPLKREGKGGALPKKGQGVSISGAESKQRLTGSSERRAVNILSNIIAQHEATLLRAEKAKVGRALLELVKAYPNKDLWEADAPELKPFLKQRKNPSPGQLSFPLEGIDTTTGLPDTLSEVVFGRDILYKFNDNVLVVKVNGEEHTITFDKQNVHAQRIVRGLKNLGDKDSNVIVDTLRTINKFLAIVNTSANPPFIIGNFARDIQTAGYNLNDTEAKDIKIKIFKDTFKALQGARMGLRGKYDTEWAKHFRDFAKGGAQVGWMDYYKNIEARETDLKKRIDRLGDGSWLSVKRAAKGLFDFVSTENSAVENAIRLSVYAHLTGRTGDKRIVSDAKGISIAKNLTVNFDRKGDSSQTLNSLFLFFGANVQGSARLIYAAAKSPKVRKMMYATVGFAVMLDILNRFIGGEDDDGENKYDKIPTWVKDKNLIVMRPSGSYFKLPLPWGYNVLHILGQEIGGAVDPNKKGFSPIKSAGRVAGGVIGAFSPLGSESTIAQFISPTVLDPFVQWWENKSFAGTPIKPEQNPFDVPKPEYQLHWKNTGAVPTWIAKQLNFLSGGTEIKPGKINISPEIFKLFFNTITGGAGQFIANTLNIPMTLMQKNIEVRKIPFISRLYGQPSEYYLNTKFYDNLSEIRYAEKAIKYYEGIKDEKGLLKTKKDYDKELTFINYAKKIKSDVGRLRDEIKKIEKRQDLTDKDRELAIEDREETVRLKMSFFNKKFSEWKPINSNVGQPSNPAPAAIPEEEEETD